MKLYLVAIILAVMGHEARAQSLEHPTMPGERNGDLIVHQDGNLIKPDTRVIIQGDGNVRVDRLSANEYASIVKLEVKISELQKQIQDAIKEKSSIERQLALSHGAKVKPFNPDKPFDMFFDTPIHDTYYFDGPFLVIRQRQYETIFGGGEVYRYIDNNGLQTFGSH